MHFNFNGKIYEHNAKIIGPQNRGLRYGDGLFETMKWKNNSLILADEHFARLWKGMQLLHFDIPKLLTPEKLSAEIIALAAKNKISAARVRITVFRGNGGIYDPENNLPNYLIETAAFSTETGSLNINGLQLCFYNEALKSIDRFSNLKHNNYLPYFMGAIFAKKQQCNDALILNSAGNICDSTIANIFVVKDGIVVTPPLSEGCVAGVMRKWLIEEIRDLNFEVREATLTKEILFNADEVFLSNSVYNIRWVASVEDTEYTNYTIAKIAEQLSVKHPAIFC